MGGRPALSRCTDGLRRRDDRSGVSREWFAAFRSMEAGQAGGRWRREHCGSWPQGHLGDDGRGEGCCSGRNGDEFLAWGRVVECCERVVSELAEDVVRAPAEFALDGETGAVVVEAFCDLEVVGVIGRGAAGGALGGLKERPTQKCWSLV